MRSLSWGGVARLGLVQASIGAVVVLMTSTLNRVMVVELGLAAAIPGALVALHFAVQMFFRPRLGHWSDLGGRRTPVIRAGMALLAFGGADAVAAVALIPTHRALGIIAAAFSFVIIGLGVSAAGTPLLALLAERVPAERRGRAAAVVWLMMIAGFVVTTLAVSRLIEPFSFARFMTVAIGVSVTSLVIAWLSLAGLERSAMVPMLTPSANPSSFGRALSQAWQDHATLGVFGAAQAIAYAIGSFIGALGSDVGRALSGSDAHGYMAVFAAEAVLFLLAALLAWQPARSHRAPLDSRSGGDALMASLA